MVQPGQCPAHTRTPWGSNPHRYNPLLRNIAMGVLLFSFIAVIVLVIVFVVGYHSSWTHHQLEHDRFFETFHSYIDDESLPVFGQEESREKVKDSYTLSGIAQRDILKSAYEDSKISLPQSRRDITLQHRDGPDPCAAELAKEDFEETLQQLCVAMNTKVVGKGLVEREFESQPKTFVESKVGEVIAANNLSATGTLGKSTLLVVAVGVNLAFLWS